MFESHSVGNPEDKFSCVVVHIILTSSFVSGSLGWRRKSSEELLAIDLSSLMSS